MSAKNYALRLIRPEERPKLVTFLLRHYTPRLEVLSKYFRLNEGRIDETEKKFIAEDLKNRYTELVSKCTGHVAIDNESKEMVAMTLMTMKKNPKLHGTKGDQECSSDSKISVPLRSKVYADFINYVLDPLEDNLECFSKYPECETAMDYELLCTHPKHSMNGLGSRMSRELTNYAESQGVGFTYSLSLSPYGRRTVEKLGYRTFKSVDISSLRDKDGNVIFKGGEPTMVWKVIKLSRATSSNEEDEVRGVRSSIIS